jgi:hypothetical protein
MPFNYDNGTTDVSVDAQDNLAKIVIQRYREAVTWQSSELLGRTSLKTVLRQCYDQAHGILDPKDREIVDSLGVKAYINLTAMKTGVVQAFLLESLVSADALPWVLEPTPIPDLSEQGVEEALMMLKDELYGNAFNGDIQALVKQIAENVYLKEKEYAVKAARKMERKIFDQTVEGGWRAAMSGFLFNFVTYPYGIMQGPVPTRSPRLFWGKNSKLKMKSEIYYQWEAISPWDFWYSPDSSNTQDGTGICLRKRVTRKRLLQMAGMKSYLRTNVEALLYDTETKPQYHFKWMSEHPDHLDDMRIHWVNCSESIDMLVHYGFFSGRELAEFGMRGLDDNKMYDATVTVIGGYTVQVFIAPDPSVNRRPVFTASFYKAGDKIANYGIAQRLRDVERCYMASLRYLMRNVANASEPIIEADYGRLAKHMSIEDITNITPGAVYITENDIMNSQYPAVRPTVIPSNIGDYMRVMEHFMDQAHTITNIPAGLSGTAVGTGANRTFRGMAMLQANAVKSIQSAVANIDETVFLPMGELLYNYNMLYEDDPAIKGDCLVYAQGVSGLLAKELARNNAMDLLQVIGAVGAQLGETATPVVDWAIQQVFASMGVPAEIAQKVSFGGPKEMMASMGPEGAPPASIGSGPQEAMPGPPPGPAPAPPSPLGPASAPGPVPSAAPAGLLV